MGERRFVEMAFQQVIDTSTQGRRVYLLLACGHEKLHNPRSDVPKRSHCQECCKP